MARRLVQALALGVGAASLALLLGRSGALDTWERVLWGLESRHLARPSEATPRIKLVLLDQASLAWGRQANQWSWPWPREAMGALVDFCRRGGARAVAFDVLYTEPSVYGVSDDEAFARSIRQGPPFVAAALGAWSEGDLRAWPVGAPEPPALPPGSAGSLKPLPLATFPVPEVLGSARQVGNVQAAPDPDGVHRRGQVIQPFDGRGFLALGLAAHVAGAGHPVALSTSPGLVTLDGRRIPVDTRGRALLRYVGPSLSHQAFSAASIIQSELRLREGGVPSVDPAVFKDCTVFFGYSAPGLFDLQPTPVGDRYPGVEVHATLLDNFLSDRFMAPVPLRVVIPVLLLLGVASALAGLAARRAWTALGGLGAFTLLPLGLGMAGFAQGEAWPVAMGMLTGGVAQLGAMAWNYATEGRQKAFLKNAFRHYLGAEVIEQLLADPGRLQLGGERRELTLFFSDIEKFSSFSERLDPATLTALLNDYLTEMGAILREEGAYLDKYIGDAIVAFWNAPLDQGDHARRACRAAVRCQRRLAELRTDYEARMGVTVKARIGLNTGVVAVGNMGSRDRFNYTVLGDAANLASRLEGANKAFGSYIMVSESTWTLSGGDFVGRELGRLRVVGRAASVTVFQLLGLPGEARPEGFAAFDAALVAFYAGRFAEALAGFQALPEDPASHLYVGLCQGYLAHPPEAWDGVLELHEK